MHFASLAINARRFSQDTRAAHYSNADWGLLIDEAAKFLQNELKILHRRISFSLVDNQDTYTLPADLLAPEEIEFYTSGGTWKVKMRTLEEIRLQRLPAYGSRPYFYTLFDDEQVVKLQPNPDTPADTTTLTGAHSATITTLTVASTDSFYDYGRVIIDSEVISYTGKTSTTFTGCTRGEEGTTAVSHSGAATITERDLFVYGLRQYRDREMRTFYITGNVDVTNASAAVAGGNSAPSWTNTVAAGDYLGITTDTTKIDATRWYKVLTVDTATTLTLDETYKDATATNQTYIICSPNPFPNRYDGFFRAYLLAAALDKEGDYKGSAQQWGKVERMLKTSASASTKPDLLLHPRGRHDHLRRPWSRMPVSGGSRYDTF